MMCGRVNQLTSRAEIAQALNLIFEPDWPAPRYNLAPTQQILAVRHNEAGKRFASPMRWGLLPPWAKDEKLSYKTFNARAETIATTASFRAAFKSRRCLIPASGFYEWEPNADVEELADGIRTTKQPWNIVRADGDQLVMAGLWERWKRPDQTEIESCTIITTEANSLMASLHDRMPVILAREHWDLWLNPDDSPGEIGQSMLVPCPDDWLDKYRVDKMVGNVKNESPKCVEPIDQ